MEKGKINLKPLTWEDFKGVPDSSSPFAAYTYWNVSYNYKYLTQSGRTVVTLNSTCTLTDKSWAKKSYQSDALLLHESCHYYIGLIMNEVFKKRVAAICFDNMSSDKIGSIIRDIFDRELSNHIDMEKLYDVETSHGGNEQAQVEWQEKILTMLKEFFEII